jgi:hypothetical protein
LLRLDQNNREAWLGGLHRFVFIFSRQGKTAKNDAKAEHPNTFLHDLRAFLHLAGSVSIALKYLFNRGQNLACVHGLHALAVKKPTAGVGF